MNLPKGPHSQGRIRSPSPACTQPKSYYLNLSTPEWNQGGLWLGYISPTELCKFEFLSSSKFPSTPGWVHMAFGSSWGQGHLQFISQSSWMPGSKQEGVRGEAYLFSVVCRMSLCAAQPNEPPMLSVRQRPAWAARLPFLKCSVLHLGIPWHSHHSHIAFCLRLWDLFPLADLDLTYTVTISF